MQLNDPGAYRASTEAEIIADLLDLSGKHLLELGCGAAWMTRLLADQFQPASIVATEVDSIQHEKNLGLPEIPNVSFRFGGAEAIDLPDESIDAVFMFKSLHHVPSGLMDPALREIRRVLVPGGHAYFSEPVYWGAFNDLIRLVHDEKAVRQAAFATLVRAVEDGMFELEREVFFQVPGTYEDWDVFEARFLKVTHTELAIDETSYAEIKQAFMAHMTPTGAHFLKPHRVDLLRKPG
jgi:ubiquinone/menaquinone biosynthesis C-methylase UbiE